MSAQPALPPVLLIAILAGMNLSASSLVGQLRLAEEHGKHIYLRGTSPSGQGITALLGQTDTEVPASVLTCASCHGYDGRGKPEGGVVPSNITWEALTKPYGITRPSGRHHPPYTERLLRRAITVGIDPAGNQLHMAMPRFQMSHQDLADLITYLKQLGKSLDPGLTETTIEVGTILPPGRRLAEMSQAVRAVLEAYFDEVNQAGGIYNRRIVLRFAESLDPSEEGITWDRLPGYAGKVTDLRAWLTRLVHNLCLDIYRERQRRTKTVQNLDEMVVANEAALAQVLESPEEVILRRELYVYIQARDQRPATPAA